MNDNLDTPEPVFSAIRIGGHTYLKARVELFPWQRQDAKLSGWGGRRRKVLHERLKKLLQTQGCRFRLPPPVNDQSMV
jgi:hypothetical protein